MPPLKPKAGSSTRFRVKLPRYDRRLTGWLGGLTNLSGEKDVPVEEIDGFYEYRCLEAPCLRRFFELSNFGKQHCPECLTSNVVMVGWHKSIRGLQAESELFNGPQE